MNLNKADRLIFEKGEQRRFLGTTKKILKCKNYNELAKFLNVPVKTFENWLYEEQSLPKNIFDKIVKNYPTLKSFRKFIFEKRYRFWGQIKGGKKTFKILIKKYGKGELQKRRSRGGKKAIKKLIKKYDITIEKDEHFWEFLGILYGDGCLSKFRSGGRIFRVIVISGHKHNDRYYFENRVIKLVERILRRKPKIKEDRKFNGIHIYFQSKKLFDYLVKNFNFPVGKKKLLIIPKELINSNQRDINAFIRGLFDTDGSLYFEKNYSTSYHYPTIEIFSKSNRLLNGIKLLLENSGFSVIRGSRRIRLRGNTNLEKWMKEIGSSNMKHISKYLVWKIKGMCLPGKIFKISDRIELLKSHKLPLTELPFNYGEKFSLDRTVAS